MKAVKKLAPSPWGGGFGVQAMYREDRELWISFVNPRSASHMGYIGDPLY